MVIKNNYDYVDELREKTETLEKENKFLKSELEKFEKSKKFFEKNPEIENYHPVLFYSTKSQSSVHIKDIFEDSIIAKQFYGRPSKIEIQNFLDKIDTEKEFFLVFLVSRNCAYISVEHENAIMIRVPKSISKSKLFAIINETIEDEGF